MLHNTAEVYITGGITEPDTFVTFITIIATVNEVKKTLLNEARHLLLNLFFWGGRTVNIFLTLHLITLPVSVPSSCRLLKEMWKEDASTVVE
jgi:hypothetical protein